MKRLIKCSKCGNTEFNLCSKHLVKVWKDEDGDTEDEKLYGINDSFEYWCTNCASPVYPEDEEETEEKFCQCGNNVDLEESEVCKECL